MERNETKHTPGPWQECRGAHGNGCSCGLVWSVPADIAVASTALIEDEVGGPVAKEAVIANARLIAAAPTLLDSLDLVVTWLDAALKCRLFPWDADQHEAATDACQQARAAIALATSANLKEPQQ